MLLVFTHCMALCGTHCTGTIIPAYNPTRDLGWQVFNPSTPLLQPRISPRETKKGTAYAQSISMHLIENSGYIRVSRYAEILRESDIYRLHFPSVFVT